MRTFLMIFILFTFLSNNPVSASSKTTTLRDALENTSTIAFPENGRPVDFTVAKALKNHLVPKAKLMKCKHGSDLPKTGVIRVAIADENFASGPDAVNGEKDWMFFRLNTSGDGEIVTSKSHLLWALFCHIKEEWLDEDISQFEKGKLLTSSFKWLRGEDGFFASKRRFTRNYDAESGIQELARMGCSHVVINALATPFPFESGPPGEIYYRFYNSAPDLDQFVETKLNKGTYPPEYLTANMQFLEKQAALAVKYGLNPGMHICNPRTVPESLLERYPYLRGARVDHPFRSYRPRYTLTLAHPVVRWHYAEMLKMIMERIPEIDFVSTFLNDSGSGFEHTMRLYPGRNGGAYLVREWNPNEAFAKGAAENVIRYYKLLRDTGREINPEFRLIAGLRAIPEEEEIIYNGMGEGIDLIMAAADKNDPVKWAKQQALMKRGALLFTGTSAKGCYPIGVPSPWLTHDRLQSLFEEGFHRTTVNVDPPSLAPWDVNREILKAYQFESDIKIDKKVEQIAIEWVGKNLSSQLIEIWKKADQAVRNAPDVPLYATNWAFEMYRLWVRPYVPDIDKIPESRREYYQKFTMSHFNNPHNVDLAADCLWELITTEDGDRIVTQFDSKVWEPLDDAIALSKKVLADLSEDNQHHAFFDDTHDRLLAAKCYFRTLRNTGAWIAGVHGYLEAKNEAEKESRLNMVREMVEDELQNARDLLELWQSTSVDFIPIFAPGETWFQYGENLGELLEKKIELMEKHRNDLPYIDPNYMWRMHPNTDFDPDEYLKY